ncbi:hypothetical protein DFA_02323 [Cavenderia fasciculata]|uniref:ELMO domain-containing protein n=1 Tax=Cavenderia fasciculata TaxID=261658 RepID=F4PZ48_CACFS|nr:uncharacterized protein DFA_02323 [Cavenderia fasciculata]EGG19077.1 hypothetical protein DFA_02323 [Cavenderia fasciculata]|eukprot:XP_004366710.1 hypothetical protein DFA_02323 [Cavenderia fasciculata]
MEGSSFDVHSDIDTIQIFIKDYRELTASLTTTPDHSNSNINSSNSNSTNQQHDITIDKVLEMIYAIADIGSIYLFRLNKYLQDQQVLTLFVERSGIDQLEKCIKELKGNALTYAYSSFPTRIIDVIIQRFSIDEMFGRSINHQRSTLFENDPTSFINMYTRYKQSLLPPGHSTEEWKYLGFHTEEPYQDANQKRRDNQCYPFSAIAINLTHLLNQSLLIGEETKNLTFVPLLFSHYHAVQELFCCIFQVFENSWLDVNADINKILALVKKQLTNVLETKKTIFDAMNMLTQRNRDISLLEQPIMTKSPDMIVTNTSMNNLGQSIPTTNSTVINQKDGGGETIGSISKLNHTDIYKSINQIVKNNIIESFKNNKTNILLKGLFFEVEKNYKLKGGVSGGSYLFIRLSNDLKQYNIQISTNISNLVESSPSSSSSQPSRKNKGKVDNSSTLLYLSNMEKESSEASSTWLELSSASRESLVDLVDGHKSIEELAALEELEMKVNMLDFVGVDSFISESAPPIPTLPSDFDFFELKLKDYHSQFTNQGKQSSSNNNNTSAATTTTRKKLVHRSVRQSMFLMQGIKDEIQEE